MTKAELHALVDALPDQVLDDAAIVLRRIQDPVVARLDAAPDDDEPLTEDDRAAIAAARQSPLEPLDDVARELLAD